MIDWNGSQIMIMSSFYFVAKLALLLTFMVPGFKCYTSKAMLDQVVSLPGAKSSFKSRHFSGFLNITSSRNIHYFYIESENDPVNDPVVFWTNGGELFLLLMH